MVMTADQEPQSWILLAPTTRHMKWSQHQSLLPLQRVMTWFRLQTLLDLENRIIMAPQRQTSASWGLRDQMISHAQFSYCVFMHAFYQMYHYNYKVT